ncbi:TPA: hypothetical protein EYN09_05480 [Candidatus Poribacteria bacterium]|nr:hypothetical protein [Candidatus Poribacteria bacterium]HIO06363.1 hypothetical protein [Candidatus Poribacteria bacterium]
MTNPIFRLTEPSAHDLATFHRDGCVVLPDVFTDEGLAGLTDEILNHDPVREYFKSLADPDLQVNDPHTYFVRPWNDRGSWGNRLIDAPLVTSLLQSTIGPNYHFCHSAMNIAPRGTKRVGFHQDHHHWFHENPVNLEERNKWYIQILYYPNGFKQGDRNLMIIPGSHRVSPTREVTPEKLLAGEFDDEAGRKLEVRHLELPPGSMVYLNARMFHGVEPKPLNSPQEYRLFVIDIFKEVGPPHRHTQEIPPEWMEQANPERKKMFQRAPYSPECWLET